MMKFFKVVMPLMAVFFILGCGGGGTTTSTTQPNLIKGPHSCDPKSGQGTMGSCTPTPPPSTGPQVGFVRGPKVPDVSEFQGHVDWNTARHHISGAIVRVADGFHNDVDFHRNWSELKRLHVWHAAYFFLRPGNCSAEADRALSITGKIDSGPLIADAEVPLNFGCAAAFVAEVHRRTHTAEVIYTAPGTWPGGPHGHAMLWVASYGPSPGCVWTCRHVAWQYTDGQVGPGPRCTPGIGCDDISSDNGITRLKAGPSKKEQQAAKRRELRKAKGEVRVYHHLIEKHNCRPGEHATPKSYHTVCGRWVRKGNEAHARARRLERQLRSQ